MAGNSKRKGAIRKTSKGPTAGSGGRVRRGLEGKGPTPKASERPYHKAYKSRQRSEREGSRPRQRTSKSSDAEWIAGRNSVVEALRAHMPVTGVYVAEGAERDGRLIALHDETLERTTNVRTVFPDRFRQEEGGRTRRRGGLGLGGGLRPDADSPCRQPICGIPQASFCRKGRPASSSAAASFVASSDFLRT